MRVMAAAILVAACAVALVDRAAAAPVNHAVNGGFEDPEGAFTDNGAGFEILSDGSTTIPGWTVIGETVFWDGPGWLGWPHHSGDFSITARNGGVQQWLTGLSPGRPYHVTFRAGGDPLDDDLTGNLAQGRSGVGSGAPVLFTVQAGTGDPFVWQTITYTFIATAVSELLVIEALDGDIAFDTVEVTRVPGPFALPLFLAALGALRLAGRARSHRPRTSCIE